MIIIRLARSASDIAGVEVQEFDTRQSGDMMQNYKVRVSPTVIIVEPNGSERDRFEGESSEIITKLRTAVKALGQTLRTNKDRL